MPTANPRITVTFKPSTHAVLRRMSQLTRKSQSALVAELVEASEPVFERMARVLEAAERAKEGTKEAVRANLEAAERVLDSQLSLMLGDLETRSEDLVDGLEAIGRREGREGADATAAAPRPPRSIRGGATPPTTGRKAAQKGRRGRP